MYVAAGTRYAHVYANFANPHVSEAELIAYATASAQRIADRAMSVEVSDQE